MTKRCSAPVRRALYLLLAFLLPCSAVLARASATASSFEELCGLSPRTFGCDLSGFRMVNTDFEAQVAAFEERVSRVLARDHHGMWCQKGSVERVCITNGGVSTFTEQAVLRFRTHFRTSTAPVTGEIRTRSDYCETRSGSRAYDHFAKGCRPEKDSVVGGKELTRDEYRTTLVDAIGSGPGSSFCFAAFRACLAPGLTAEKFVDEQLMPPYDAYVEARGRPVDLSGRDPWGMVCARLPGDTRFPCDASFVPVPANEMRFRLRGLGISGLGIDLLMSSYEARLAAVKGAEVVSIEGIFLPPVKAIAARTKADPPAVVADDRPCGSGVLGAGTVRCPGPTRPEKPTKPAGPEPKLVRAPDGTMKRECTAEDLMVDGVVDCTRGPDFWDDADGGQRVVKGDTVGRIAQKHRDWMTAGNEGMSLWGGKGLVAAITEYNRANNTSLGKDWNPNVVAPTDQIILPSKNWIDAWYAKKTGKRS